MYSENTNMLSRMRFNVISVPSKNIILLLPDPSLHIPAQLNVPYTLKVPSIPRILQYPIDNHAAIADMRAESSLDVGPSWIWDAPCGFRDVVPGVAGLVG